jgi:hypothetical protein
MTPGVGDVPNRTSYELHLPVPIDLGCLLLDNDAVIPSGPKTEMRGLPAEGLAPTLIEWQTEQYPTALLEDRGCALVRLDGFHPDSGRILRTLESLDLEEAVILHPLPPGERPYLVAQIKTPMGLRTLGGPHR